MANLLEMVSSENGKKIEKVLSKMKVEQIHYSKVKPSKDNFYSQEGILELADNLIMAGMILQPLIVRRTDIGEYEVIAGHRRRLASIYNVEKRNEKKFEFLPCIVLKIDEMVVQLIETLEKDGESLTQDQRDRIEDVIVEYIMISTNSTARKELTDYECMMEAMKWRQLIPLMTGNEEIKGRALREAVAKETGRGNGTIGSYENIYRNLIPFGMERFKNGDLGLVVASKVAGLSKEDQEKILVRDVITIRDVEEFIKEDDSVSNVDTKLKESIETVHTDNVDGVDNELDVRLEDIWEESDPEETVSEEECKEESTAAAVLEEKKIEEEKTEKEERIYSVYDVNAMYRDMQNRYKLLEEEASRRESEYLIRPRRNTKIMIDALELLMASMEGQKC